MKAIEPNNAERSEWSETTREYVEELELIYDGVMPLLDEFQERSQYYYGKSGAFAEAFERLKKRVQIYT